MSNSKNTNRKRYNQRRPLRIERLESRQLLAGDIADFVEQITPTEWSGSRRVAVEAGHAHMNEAGHWNGEILSSESFKAGKRLRVEFGEGTGTFFGFSPANTRFTDFIGNNDYVHSGIHVGSSQNKHGGPFWLWHSNTTHGQMLGSLRDGNVLEFSPEGDSTIVVSRDDQELTRFDVPFSTQDFLPHAIFRDQGNSLKAEWVTLEPIESPAAVDQVMSQLAEEQQTLTTQTIAIDRDGQPVAGRNELQRTLLLHETFDEPSAISPQWQVFPGMRSPTVSGGILGNANPGWHGMIHPIATDQFEMNLVLQSTHTNVLYDQQIMLGWDPNSSDAYISLDIGQTPRYSNTGIRVTTYVDGERLYRERFTKGSPFAKQISLTIATNDDGTLTVSEGTGDDPWTITVPALGKPLGGGYLAYLVGSNYGGSVPGLDEITITDRSFSQPADPQIESEADQSQATESVDIESTSDVDLSATVTWQTTSNVVVNDNGGIIKTDASVAREVSEADADTVVETATSTLLLHETFDEPSAISPQWQVFPGMRSPIVSGGILGNANPGWHGMIHPIATDQFEMNLVLQSTHTNVLYDQQIMIGWEPDGSDAYISLDIGQTPGYSNTGIRVTTYVDGERLYRERFTKGSPFAKQISLTIATNDDGTLTVSEGTGDDPWTITVPALGKPLGGGYLAYLVGSNYGGSVPGLDEITITDRSIDQPDDAVTLFEADQQQATESVDIESTSDVDLSATVTWQTTSNVVVNDNGGIIKTDDSYHGAAVTAAAINDAYIAVTGDMVQVHRAIALSPTAVLEYDNRDYRMHFRPNFHVELHALGKWTGVTVVSGPGDRFQIEQVGDQVRYLHNEQVIHEVSLPDDSPLFPMVHLYKEGARFEQVAVGERADDVEEEAAITRLAVPSTASVFHIEGPTVYVAYSSPADEATVSIQRPDRFWNLRLGALSIQKQRHPGGTPLYWGAVTFNEDYPDGNDYAIVVNDGQSEHRIPLSWNGLTKTVAVRDSAHAWSRKTLQEAFASFAAEQIETDSEAFIDLSDAATLALYEARVASQVDAYSSVLAQLPASNIVGSAFGEQLLRRGGYELRYPAEYYAARAFPNLFIPAAEKMAEIRQSVSGVRKAVQGRETGRLYAAWEQDKLQALGRIYDGINEYGMIASANLQEAMSVLLQIGSGASERELREAFNHRVVLSMNNRPDLALIVGKPLVTGDHYMGAAKRLLDEHLGTVHDSTTYWHDAHERQIAKVNRVAQQMVDDHVTALEEQARRDSERLEHCSRNPNECTTHHSVPESSDVNVALENSISEHQVTSGSMGYSQEVTQLVFGERLEEVLADLRIDLQVILPTSQTSLLLPGRSTAELDSDQHGTVLHSLSDEQSIIDEEGLIAILKRRQCEDGLAASPDAFACGWWHARNNCLLTRYWGESTAIFLSLINEDKQLWQAIFYPWAEQEWSAFQASDFSDNRLGRQLALNPNNDSMSCEQLATIALNGHRVADLPEGFGTHRPPGLPVEVREWTRETLIAFGEYVLRMVPRFWSR